MSSAGETVEQPLVTLVIDDQDGEDLTIRLITRGLTMSQAREYLRMAMLNLDQKIWCEQAMNSVANLPASAF